MFVIVPPVADHVTATLAVNCCVCPDCTVALAGEIVTDTGAGIVTCADALLVRSAIEVAVTVKALPGVDPAVKRPLFDIVPPVADHVTATLAVNCLVCPGCTVALVGEIETCIG